MRSHCNTCVARDSEYDVNAAAPMAGLVVNQRVIHRDIFAYSAHPHLVATSPGNWLLVFTQTRRREGIVIHPPQDPLYQNMMVHSQDEGRTWSEPHPVPDFGWHGVECAGLTALRSGIVLLSQWRFQWHSLSYANACLPPSSYKRPDDLMGAAVMSVELRDWAPEKANIAERYPWARTGGETWVHRSFNAGRTFTQSIRVDVAPFSGGYGMRGGVELDGEVLMPFSDVPNYRSIFTVRSADDGETWSAPSLVAEGDGHEFEEPAPLLLKSGRIIMLLRDNITRILHMVRSDDGGVTWTKPVVTGISDYPADLVLLNDGRIACVAGRRQPPFGITLYLSEDDGESWNAPTFVTTGLPNRDLGYPSAALRANGNLYVVWYAQDSDGVTGIHAGELPSGFCHLQGEPHGQG